MRLFEHPEFEQAILRAAEHFAARGLRPAMIEKDYYVTEALRAIAAVSGDKIIFKGGTSLSKGWNLIERFSEDIDIFLDPATFDTPLGNKAKNTQLKRLRDAVKNHPGLTYLAEESGSDSKGRNDYFSFSQIFPGEISNRFLLESGTASGREPTQEIELQSFLAQFLKETRQSPGAEDETSFHMKLLHFRRTFVEKLFTIHAKVEIYKREGRPIGTYARHYYDLFQLAGRPEVPIMLDSDEYAKIKADYDLISRTHFPQNYIPPEGMSFAKSDALFPTGDLLAVIRKDYEAQCKVLCFGTSPSWDDVQERFAELQSLL